MSSKSRNVRGNLHRQRGLRAECDPPQDPRKRQNRREAVTQSHGPAPQVARLPKGCLVPSVLALPISSAIRGTGGHREQGTPKWGRNTEKKGNGHAEVLRSH